MISKLTLDKAGRVVIPKPVRDELQLAPGDTFELESVGENLVLRPVSQRSTMIKKDGAWLIKTGKSLSVEDVNDVIRSVRDDRDLGNFGSLRK